MNLRRCSIGQLVTETAFSQIVPVRPNVPHTLCSHGQRDEERRKVMSSLDIQRWSNDFTALTKVISEGIEQFVLRFISS